MGREGVVGATESPPWQHDVNCVAGIHMYHLILIILLKPNISPQSWIVLLWTPVWLSFMDRLPSAPCWLPTLSWPRPPDSWTSSSLPLGLKPDSVLPHLKMSAKVGIVDLYLYLCIRFSQLYEKCSSSRYSRFQISLELNRETVNSWKRVNCTTAIFNLFNVRMPQSSVLCKRKTDQVSQIVNGLDLRGGRTYSWLWCLQSHKIRIVWMKKRRKYFLKRIYVQI